jgi:hypothetical protein
MHVRMFIGLVAAATVAGSFFVASAASAAAVVFDQTFDLTAAIITPTTVTSFNNTGFTPQLTNGSPFTGVSNGDSFDYKVTFKPGQGLMFNGMFGDFGLFQIGLVTPDFVAIAGNPSSTLRLFDTSGATIKTLAVNGFTSSQPNVLGDTMGPIGVPLTGTLGGLEFFNPSVSGLGSSTHFTASVVSLTATSGGFTLVSVPVATTPEPEVWALMLGGFFGLGVVLRRRRAALARA